MSLARWIGPVGAAALLMAVLVAALHLPVLTEGALVTPAGMHHAMWPWRGLASQVREPGALLQENYTLSDLLFQVYPWQAHTARALARGTVPLWNPHSYTGVPFVANAQSAVFYPLHWPAWAVPSLRVFTWALLMKIFLAGVFMAVFLRGLGMGPAAASIGAVSFGLCGFMTSWLGYAHTNAAIWLPLLMHAARGVAVRPGAGPVMLLAAATGAQFLGGHPETSLHIVVAAGVWFAWCARGAPRAASRAALFGGAVLMGAALAAIQLLPFVEYLVRSAALEQRRALAGMDPSLPAGALLTMLVPDRYGMPWNFSYHGPAPFQAVVGYAGAGVLLLAALSAKWWRQTAFFHGMAAVSALVVFGPEGVRRMMRWIPLVGISSNNRLLLLLAFSLAVLAAWALQRWTEEASRPGDRGRRLAWLAAAALVLGGAAWWAGRTGTGSSLAAFALVGATALLAAMAVVRPSGRALYVAGIVAICAIDMFLFAFRFNPHADPGQLFPSTPLITFLKDAAASDPLRGGRLMTVGWTMRPETQMVYELSSIEGYDAMEDVRYRRLLDRAGVAEIHRTGHIPEVSRRLLDLAGLRFIVTPPGGVVSGGDITLDYEGPDGRVFTNRQALPRVVWVPSHNVDEDPVAALEALASGLLDPRREVVIESPESAPGNLPGDPPPSAMSLTRVADDELVIEIRGAARAGWLAVMDAYDKGWKATVNGRPAHIRRANVCFRAVEVPAGDSTVRMVYRPLSFRAGAWISAIAVLACGAVPVARKGRRRAVS